METLEDLMNSVKIRLTDEQSIALPERFEKLFENTVLNDSYPHRFS